MGRNLIASRCADNFELLTPKRGDLDLLRDASVVEYLDFYKPDIVIHCAGLVGGIQANINRPVSFLTENLSMGVNLVAACAQAGVTKLLNLGSSCMYPKGIDTAIPESALLSGRLEPTNEGYALAKLVTHKLCEYISKEYPELDYKTLIPCNIYGPHDKFCPEQAHLIPAVIHKLHVASRERWATVDVWGDGAARREFMYAADLADCVWSCINNFESMPTLMNVGQGDDHSIATYYREIAAVVGYDGEFMFDITKPVGMKRKLVDSTVIRQWGWEPKYQLREGLELTYEYFLQEVCGE